MPISYDNAFGGVDRTQEDPAKHRWYPLNHAGIGYHPNAKARTSRASRSRIPKRLADRLPAARQVSANGVRPGRPRMATADKVAGTYDQKWLDEKFPFLPEDFDKRYFQSAPEDQQTDTLEGGEPVS